MQIDIRGRNVEVTEELREAVLKRFERIERQADEPVQLEVELREEKNPAIAERFVAQATLRMKGVTLHAEEATPEMLHSIHHVAEDIRRQLKKRKEKLRKRSRTRRMVNRLRGRTV